MAATWCAYGCIPPLLLRRPAHLRACGHTYAWPQAAVRVQSSWRASFAMARVLCSYDKAFVFACRKGSRTNDVRVTKYDGEELIARWPDYDPATGVAPTYPPKVATGCGTEARDEATDHLVIIGLADTCAQLFIHRAPWFL